MRILYTRARTHTHTYTYTYTYTHADCACASVRVCVRAPVRCACVRLCACLPVLARVHRMCVCECACAGMARKGEHVSSLAHVHVSEPVCPCTYVHPKMVLTSGRRMGALSVTATVV